MVTFCARYPSPCRRYHTRVQFFEPPAVLSRIPRQETGSATANCRAQGMSGFAPVGSILDTIPITKLRPKQPYAIRLVREQRGNGKQELAYHARAFVSCDFPLCRAPRGQLVQRRRNGKLLLAVVAHPRFGLPTVRADCTCAQFGFGMGRNSSSLPPAAWAAIRSSQEKAQSRRRYAHSPRTGAWYPQHSA